MTVPDDPFAQRLDAVLARIASAAARAGRRASEIRLIGVGKKFSAEQLTRAIDLGLTDIGENRVQEADEKKPHVEGAGRATWHMIGHLQRNKAARAVELFDLIHTVDSPRLGRALGRLGETRGRPVEALVQVNVGSEPQKSGVEPARLREIVEQLAGTAGIAVRGLMCIPPPAERPEDARPHFAELRRLARSIEDLRIAEIAMDHLSMGMSQDFVVAVEEGATLVRVGSALFGPRPQ